MANKLRGLYAITPEAADGTRLLADVEAAMAGGCRIVQFRDKLSAMPERAARARALRELTRRFGATLLINDDLALAFLVKADGVHLGADDGNLIAARAMLGPERILGASCYADFAAAQAADTAGADYIAFGAVYPSPTKPAAPAAAVDLFSKAKTTFTATTCAIGGITLDNAPPLLAAGADLLAVITDLFGAPDIAGTRRPIPTTFRESHAMTSRNQQLFERAQRHIPGGVNSPVRAFRSVGGTPCFFQKGVGPKVQDADGKWYVDYVGSWGPMILGHAHPDVIAAVQAAAVDGLSFGAPTEKEVEIADLLCELVPSMDMVRLVSSGTEATMSAIRLARGYTGRDVLIKFEGCYHGHSDSLLVKAGSGALTFGNPSSSGVPADLAQHTMVLAYNDPQQLADAFAEHGGRIAAVIVEPVVGNMNLIAPTPEFLTAMREQCTQHGAVLIFDEVMTGFRVGLKSAQGLFGITPDLSTFGKVVGGGMPLGAFGGKREIMEQIAPLGPVYQAGTLSGNPIATAAGLATLKLIQKKGFYEALTAKTKALCDGLVAAANKHGVAFAAQNVGGMFGLYFADKCPGTYEEVLACDKDAFNRFFHAMLDAGHYFAPSAFEAGFVSAAHGEADIASTIAAADAYFASLK